MPKKKRNLNNDILYENQNDINDRTSLKYIKEKKESNSKKLKAKLNIKLILDYLFPPFKIDLARSCPHAASISCPNSFRTVTSMARFLSLS